MELPHCLTGLHIFRGHTPRYRGIRRNEAVCTTDNNKGILSYVIDQLVFDAHGKYRTLHCRSIYFPY